MVPRSLPRLRIATACNADWNAMSGTDHARHCGHCGKTVYNVENLRPREVAALLEAHGDRVPCLRLFVRPDGTVVTRGCLAWVGAGVRRARMGVVSIAALALGFWSNVFLWRGRIHREPLAPPPMAGTYRLGGLAPPPLPPDPGGHLLRPEGKEPSELAVRDALKPAIARMQAHGPNLEFSIRVDLRLGVKANGRVDRVEMIAPPELPARVGKMVERTARRLRLPPSSEEYQVEFSVLFASRD
jgi:hypothetical protein